MACRILASGPGIKPVPPAVEVLSLTHWTAWEVQKPSFQSEHLEEEPTDSSTNTYIFRLNSKIQ